MTEAFWDSSALVPLCVQQKAISRAGELLTHYAVVVWWAAPVEAHSAFARDLRNGVITTQQHAQARSRLESLNDDWREILPVDTLRHAAEWLVDRFPLRAADALQLAAAYTWTSQLPKGRPFISGDRRLLNAADQLGFQTIET